jgi:hypothetical protein
MSDKRTYLCPRHHTRIVRGIPCPECEAFLSGCPSGVELMPGERIRELHWWLDDDTMTVTFSDLHGRIEALMGRPVYTHEFTAPHRLIAEVESRTCTAAGAPQAGGE